MAKLRFSETPHKCNGFYPPLIGNAMLKSGKGKTIKLCTPKRKDSFLKFLIYF